MEINSIDLRFFAKDAQQRKVQVYVKDISYNNSTFKRKYNNVGLPSYYQSNPQRGVTLIATIDRPISSEDDIQKLV